jgi:hypothetical protein
MQKFVSFRGLRPLDPHQGFALDPLGASRQLPDPLSAFYCAPPPCSKIPKSALHKPPYIYGLTIANRKCEIYRLNCKFYTLKCKIYRLNCKIYRLKCKFYRLKCKIYKLKCKIYRLKCKFLHIKV